MASTSALDPGAANILVERLVSTIARAFYTDPFVVVFDTLLREKSIRFEELGPRLKMTAKEIRAITTQLEAEMMIHKENLLMEDGSSVSFYYIDYQLFVHVVRYRIHLMTADIKQAEKSELSDVHFECPTCKKKYDQLEVQKYRTLDLKFACPDCCPHDNIRQCRSEPSFRLVEVNDAGKLTDIQVLAKRMDEQLKLSTTDDLTVATDSKASNTSNNNVGSSNNGAGGGGGPTLLHDGILELLAQLRDVPLIRNRPSDNRLRGIGASKIVDEDVQRDAIESIGIRKVQKEAKQKAGILGMTIMGEDVGADEFTVTIADDRHHPHGGGRANSGDQEHPAGGGGIKRPRDYAFPEFLRNSRVATTTSTNSGFMNATNNAQASSSSASTSGNGASTTPAAAAEEEVTVEEDVDWETET